MTRFVLIVAALAGAAVLNGCASTPASIDSGASQVATVTRVVDGDTVKVRLGGKSVRVRYIGMDTPESVKPDSPVECFGKAASKLNDELIGGRKVKLSFDVERRDRYGRLLAYVRRASDGMFINEELLRRGYAMTLTIPPNVRYAKRFRDVQRAARRAGRGLWSACPR